MKSYVEQLQAYIAANPPKYHFCNGESVLQMLYFSYTESNPIVDPKIRSGFRVLRRYIKDLPRNQEEIVFDTICDLCSEHEYRAFVEGVRAGVSLMTELDGFKSREISACGET